MEALRVGWSNARLIDVLGEENPKKAYDYFHAIVRFEQAGVKPPPERVPPERWAEVEAEQVRIRKKKIEDTENGGHGGRPMENFDPDFDLFWKAYPRQERKLEAQHAWTETKDLRPPLDALLAKLRRACLVWKAERTEAKFIPHPSSWLREHRWEDKI